MTRSWIRNWFTRPAPRPIRRAPHRTRLAVEALEGRWVPSTFVVTNPTDTPVTGLIDLRQAIAMANTNVGDDTITFDKTVFKTPQTIPLGGSQLELSDTSGTTTITGPKAGVTVDGGGASRVFQIDALVTASISGLTITGGNPGLYDIGGGLFNLGTLTLTNCTVSGNSASYGGGISNRNTLIVASSTINNNQATSAGGGISTTGGSATITDSVINSNRVDSSGTALGGSIDCENSVLSLTNCTVNANQANGANAYGGGIYALNSTVTLQSCTVNGNKVNGSVLGKGGGIYRFNSVLTLVASIVNGNKATASDDDIFDGS
jgi:hypothetical protein